MNPFRKVGNSMIFICLTPNPKGEHLKIIELESPPLGVRGSKDLSELTHQLKKNIAISGNGIIDGQGQELMPDIFKKLRSGELKDDTIWQFLFPRM